MSECGHGGMYAYFTSLFAATPVGNQPGILLFHATQSCTTTAALLTRGRKTLGSPSFFCGSASSLSRSTAIFSFSPEPRLMTSWDVG